MRERRLVGEDCFECPCVLHLDSLVSAFPSVRPARSHRRTSTSPGGGRSSQGTSRASSAARALVRDAAPGRPREQHRVEADAAVRGGEDVSALGPPGLDDPVDRARVELRAIREDDDRRFGLGGQRGEPAAQRRARAELASRGTRRSRPRAGAHPPRRRRRRPRFARPRRAPAAAAPAALAASCRIATTRLLRGRRRRPSPQSR